MPSLVIYAVKKIFCLYIPLSFPYISSLLIFYIIYIYYDELFYNKCANNIFNSVYAIQGIKQHPVVPNIDLECY